jgi:hypothetical protein
MPISSSANLTSLILTLGAIAAGVPVGILHSDLFAGCSLIGLCYGLLIGWAWNDLRAKPSLSAAPQPVSRRSRVRNSDCDRKECHGVEDSSGDLPFRSTSIAGLWRRFRGHPPANLSAGARIFAAAGRRHRDCITVGLCAPDDLDRVDIKSRLRRVDRNHRLFRKPKHREVGC